MFYTDGFGFTLLERDGGRATLGVAGTPVLLLTERAGAKPWPRERRSYTGLYHFAILVPTRADLGRWLRHWLDVGYPLIAEGRLDGDPVFLVQVVTVLHDVVDRQHSIIERHPTYELLQFPAFFRRAAPTVAGRIFRVPGNHVMIFMGETVKQALDTAGIKGFIYVPVDWSE